jgi:N-methylhydantoinase A
LLGGRVKIDQAKSCDAVSRLADKLGLDVLSTAQGIVSVVTANMAKAMRVVSVERGYDPRDFTLMAFGGAGPIHAARLAKELDIPSILVPRTPGIMCALGLLLGDLRTNLSTACVVRLAPEALDFVNATFSEMEGEANTWLAGQGASITRVSISRSLDMRYVSQAHTINVPVEHGDPLSDAVRLRKKFEAVYRQVYGFTAESDAVEIISVRTDVLGEVSKVDLTRYPDATSPVSEAVTGHRDVYVPEAGKMVSVPLYDRNRLGPGHRITGPAIVDQMDSTTWVIPGQVATVDPYLNLIIKS